MTPSSQGRRLLGQYQINPPSLVPKVCGVISSRVLPSSSRSQLGAIAVVYIVLEISWTPDYGFFSLPSVLYLSCLLHQCFHFPYPDKVFPLFPISLFIDSFSYYLLYRPFPHLQVVQAMAQGMA